MTDIQVGDKVRLTIEGEVSELSGAGLHIGGDYVPSYQRSRVEVIEKKVTTFKPGDVVRSKALGFRYTIGRDGGYLSHAEGFRWWPDLGDKFTSEHYELVTLHESPL
jgi:hypothetical protein